MKIGFIYSIGFLVFCCIGCQQEYSDSLLSEYFTLDNNLKRSNQLIEQSIEALMMEMEVAALEKISYQPIF